MQIPTTLLALALANIVVAVPTPLLGLTGPVNALAASVISATAPVTSPVFTVAGPTVGGVLNQVVAILSSVCPNYTACNTTVTGGVGDLLTNGKDFAGRTSIAGWCEGGHCYGGVQLSGTIPAPMTITCDPKINFCTGFIAGSINQTFVNGPQVEAWGWAVPTGYCKAGVCTGSVNILGDPAY